MILENPHVEIYEFRLRCFAISRPPHATMPSSSPLIAFRTCFVGLAALLVLASCGGGNASQLSNGTSTAQPTTTAQPSTTAQSSTSAQPSTTAQASTASQPSTTAQISTASQPSTTAQSPTTSQASSAPPLVSPAFYVSPSGSDGNNGQSPSTPFLTLERAQAAMQTSSVKTSYLLGGLYARTATLTLGQRDAAESWLGYPGQTPILDGASTVQTALFIASNNVTVRWLTIQNFTQNGISVSAATGVIIDSNTVSNIKSNSWAQSAILISSGSTNTQISHNAIHSVGYDGILAAASSTSALTNLVIEYNAVSATCLSVADCGGIYVVDQWHQSTGVVINNNVIGDYGLTSNQSKAIYLDDEMSNTLVENNIAYGTGTYAFQIHGGDHNLFQNNIFDISGATMLGLYQSSVTSLPNYGMTNNVVTCNIVYSSGAPPSSLWYEQVASVDAPPAFTDNLYWDSTAALPNLGSIVDAIPTVANPNFVNPSLANYAFASTTPNFCTFVPISTTQVGPTQNL